MVPRAFGLSLALHALALVVLALVWPLVGARPDRATWQLTAWLGDEAAPSSLVPGATATAPATPPPTEVELRAPGDSVVDVAHASAPTAAPNPDPLAGAAAASSGHGAGAPTMVTDRADLATLRVQPYDAAHDYQLQRIRTGDRRRSREEVRATPHPEATPWLAAAARGRGHADADRVRTVVAASPSAPRDEDDDDPKRAPRLARADEAGRARPDLARAPASTESPVRADDVADRVQSALVSDERHPAPLELSRPTSPGAGTSGQGAGALGYAPDGRGAAPVPTGAPSLPTARELALATFQRVYDRYLSRVKQKVDPLWEFPRELALRMEQGDVLIGFTIRKDGTVRDLRVLKASGFPSFDKNVLAAIKKAAPFDPLPETLGSELHVTAPFEGSNPAIR